MNDRRDVPDSSLQVVTTTSSSSNSNIVSSGGGNITSTAPSDTLESNYRRLLQNFNISGANNILSLTSTAAMEIATQLAGMIEQQIAVKKKEKEERCISKPTSGGDGNPLTTTARQHQHHNLVVHRHQKHQQQFPSSSCIASPNTTSPSRLHPSPTAGQPRRKDSDFSIRSLKFRPAFRVSRKVQHATDDAHFHVLNGYTMLREVGRGTFGVVQVAVDNETSQTRAIKIISKSLLKKIQIGGDHGIFENFQREVAIMKCMRHKNVIILHEVIDDPADNKMYMIMDYHEKGAVAKMNVDGSCEKLPEDRVKKYIRQAAAGLEYVHRHAVLHRDVKPDNLLLDDDDNIVITDFGISEAFKMDSPTSAMIRATTKGTPAFLAPELLESSDILDHATAVDVWALGVTMYCLLYGTVPFNGKTFLEITCQIRNRPLQFPADATQSQMEILTRLLDKEPSTRITLTQLRKDEYFADAYTTPSPISASSTRRPALPLQILSLHTRDFEEAITTPLYPTPVRQSATSFPSSSPPDGAMTPASHNSSPTGGGGGLIAVNSMEPSSVSTPTTSEGALGDIGTDLSQTQRSNKSPFSPSPEVVFIAKFHALASSDGCGMEQQQQQYSSEQQRTVSVTSPNLD